MDKVYELIDLGLDYGISEAEFWDMTFAEFYRAIQSKKRVELIEAKERAIFDYQLASLIGRYMARNFSNSVKIPELYEAYPSFFNEEELEEKKQERLDTLSAIRFQQFANSFNQKFQEGGK